MRLTDVFYPQEYKALVRLGVPVVVGQLGMTLQGLADTIMVGRHSTNELAAVGFVNNVFMLAILLCVGFTMGAISQLGSSYAKDQQLQMISLLKSSIVADGLQCLMVLLAMTAVYFGIPFMGQPVELLPLIKPYFLILLVSLPFLSLAGAYKLFFDSKGDTWVSMAVTLVGNVWNVIFNALLIFGLCGFPELGLEGAGWATLTSRVVMFILYAAAFHGMPRYRQFQQIWRKAKVDRRHVGLLSRLGWPTGFQMSMEAAAFSLCAVMLGWVSATALAAHQVMMNVSMIVYLFYIGIGNAVSIRVSNHFGRGDRLAIRHAASAGYQMILLVGAVMCSLVFLFRYHISGLFTDSAEVSATVVTLVWPMIFYQLGDGMQSNYANVLRGLGDVKPLLRYSFIAYVVISLPTSYLFGIVLRLGALGVWMGFPISLTIAGILYFRRFRKVIQTI
jgi:MATE family multidrug resistance protein